MVTDRQQTIAGIVVFVVSAALLFVAGTIDLAAPLVLAAVATSGLAIGSLLIGTTGEGRPV